MISVRDILGGAVTRFLPTVVGSALALLLVFDGKNIVVIRPAGWFLFLGLMSFETIGFAAFLWLARFRLAPSADVSGRRSVVAGAFGLVGVFAASIFLQGAHVATALSLASVSGMVAGAMVFWPWLRSRPSEGEMSLWESIDVQALERGAGPARPIAQQQAGFAARPRDEA